MSDDMIRGILLERKRQEMQKQADKAMVREIVEGFIGFGSLIFIAFMLLTMGR